MKQYFVLDSKVKIDFSSVNQKNIKLITIKCGEKVKTLKAYKDLTEKLINHNVNRKSVIIAIGGGTLGDLSGFVASTLLRGLDFYLIPTTLLSQVDSSIGGKNGINSKFVSENNIKIITIKCGEKIKTFEGYKILSEKIIRNPCFSNHAYRNRFSMIKFFIIIMTFNSMTN